MTGGDRQCHRRRGALRHGTQLDLTGPAPANAAGLYKGLRIRRPNPTLYGDFVRAAAEHFKGRVDRYSIWNEPNYPAWLAPQRQSPAL